MKMIPVRTGVLLPVLLTEFLKLPETPGNERPGFLLEVILKDKKSRQLSLQVYLSISSTLQTCSIMRGDRPDLRDDLVKELKLWVRDRSGCP